MANLLFGDEVTGLINELVMLQNPDGGFGELAGYQSTVLDTAYALKALSRAGYANSQVIIDAIGYLSQQQDTTGGFGLGGANDNSVYITAQVSLALQPYVFTYQVGNQINQASTYLYDQQLPAGGWQTVWETAQALLALVPVTTDTSRYANALTVLRNAQSANGSWSDNVYATALADRVLFLVASATLPVDPTAGVLNGKIVNQSGLALVGVTITAASASASQSATSATDGTFVLQGIVEGEYTVSYTLGGYLTATQSITVQAGDLLDVGTIRMMPLSTEGVLQGTVVDSDTGLPVAGASVAITGATTQSVFTDMAGMYSAAVTPGSISVTVTATGYTPVTGNTTVNAGQTMVFSPALVPVTSTNPQTTVTLTGVVIDAMGKAPISGATISVTGSATGSVTSDAAGQFSLTDLIAGDIIITISAPGFQSSAFSALTSTGSTVNLGTVQLEQIVAPATSTATGTILDATTGLPVIGATVTVEGTGISVTSDVNGNYTVMGIASLQYSLFVSAPGYLSGFQAVRLSQVGLTTIDFNLQQASVSGVAIDGLWTDQLAYSAYNTANITSVIRNGSSTTSTVKLLLEVLDSSSQHIQTLAVEEGGVWAAVLSTFNILPGATLDISSSWYVGNLAPGAYTVSLKVFDNSTNALLAERVSQISLQPTQVIEHALLTTSPRFTTVGAMEQLMLNLAAINKSNVQTSMDVSYTLTSPSGAIVTSGQRTVTLMPNNVEMTTQLTSVPVTFSESGNYTASFNITDGTMPVQLTNAVISVAPAIRVEASQNLTPTQVVPDSDKRIRLEIQLRGVESP